MKNELIAYIDGLEYAIEVLRSSKSLKIALIKIQRAIEVSKKDLSEEED